MVSSTGVLGRDTVFRTKGLVKAPGAAPWEHTVRTLEHHVSGSELTSGHGTVRNLVILQFTAHVGPGPS